MTAFRSLFFRELRITRKAHILAAAVTLFAALYFILAIFAIKSMKLSEFSSYEEMISYRSSLVLMSAVIMCFLPVITNVTDTSSLKSDINSGWLRYSYAMPIEPSVRAAVLVAMKLVFSISGMIFGIICTCFYCHFAETDFQSCYPVIYAVIFDISMLSSLYFDSIIFTARSAEELKKKTNITGLTLLAVIAVPSCILAKKVSGSAINVNNIISRLSKPVMLVWLIPLAAALSAADYFIIRKKLSVPYGSAKSNKRTKPEKKAVITDTHDYPTGFLYKELKQNRLNIILTAVLPLFMLILNYSMAFVMSLDGSEGDLKTLFMTGEAKIFYYLTTALGAYIASGLITSVFSGDDRKLWAYFTVSTPQSVKGFMYYKYVLCFALNGAYLVGCIFTNSIYDTVCYAVTGRESSDFSMILFMIFFLILFSCAIDVPLMVRYGQKKGSIINSSLMLTISIVIIVAFSFLPEKAQDRIFQLAINLRNGSAGEYSILILSISLLLILAGYALSYRISCKIFMKGVDGYDK